MNKETHANTSNVSVQECSICGPYEIKADGLVDVSDCFHYGGNRQPPAEPKCERCGLRQKIWRLRNERPTKRSNGDCGQSSHIES